MNAMRKRAAAALAAFAAVGAVVAWLVVVPALATQPVDATTSLIAQGQFGEINAKAKAGLPTWSAKIQTQGFSNLVVVELTVQPGGNFGWHTHPGPEFAIVKSGTATYYEADDPTCTAQVVSAGHGRFTPAGDEHIVRNEGAVPLVVVGNLLLPTGAAPRIDQPDPGNCSF